MKIPGLYKTNNLRGNQSIYKPWLQIWNCTYDEISITNSPQSIAVLSENEILFFLKEKIQPDGKIQFKVLYKDKIGWTDVYSNEDIEDTFKEIIL